MKEMETINKNLAKITTNHTVLINAMNKVEESKAYLALAFYNAYTKKEKNDMTCWQNLNYASFKAYIEEEFGIEYRNAMYYVKIGEKLNELGLTIPELEELGWSKFKKLLPALKNIQSKEEFLEVKDKVKQLSNKELDKIIVAIPSI